MTPATPKLSPLSWAALILGGAALVILALQGSKLVKAAFMPSAGVGDVRKTVEEQALRYAAAFEPQMAQINGRQLFLMPAPASVAEVGEAPEEPVDTTPRAPTVYAGPSVVAMINGALWFSNGTRIAKGERDGDLKVVDIDAPWSAQVEWRGSEFTIKLFDRDAVILPVSERSSSRRTPVVAAPELSAAPAKPKPPERNAEPAKPQTGAAQGEQAPSSPPPEQVEPAPEPVPEPVAPDEGEAPSGDNGPGEPSPESGRSTSGRSTQTPPTK